MYWRMYSLPYSKDSTSLLERVLLQQTPRDDQTLQLIGSPADHHQRSVAIIALHRKVFGIAVASEDAHRFERNLSGGFGGEQLGHAGFEIAALAAILFLRGRFDQQPR